MKSKYDICMVGLGPVGTVSGVCFAKQGFKVVGVDVDPKRVAAFKSNEAPFMEPKIDELIVETQAQRLFTATVDAEAAMSNSRVIMLAVGTPTPPSGEPNLTYLEKAAETIGRALKLRQSKDRSGDTHEPIIVLRSTVPPGTMRNRLAPIIEEHSGLKMGEGFHIGSNPEFLREGKAVDDFFDCARIVIGADNAQVADELTELYRDVNGRRMRVSVESAEFAKYVDNSWHAVKVAYANEVGRVAAACGVDVDDMTELFISDDKLNISQYYMRPGVSFGGSCLPKDVRGLLALARKTDINLPLTASILDSNDAHTALTFKAVMAEAPAKVGLLGVAFKPHIDDLRESPFLTLAEWLQAEGVDVKAYDEAYEAGDALVLPNHGSLATLSANDTLVHADVLVLCHDTEEMRQLAAQHEAAGKVVIDMTKVNKELTDAAAAWNPKEAEAKRADWNAA